MSPRFTQPSSKMKTSEILVLSLLNFCLLAIVAVDSQETNCSGIINEDIRQNLESLIVDISIKSCSITNDEDRTCVCGSIQTLQDNASQNLIVDLHCSCAFSKSVNCTQTECSSLETSTTVENLTATERPFTLMPTTSSTTCILTTPSMVSPTLTIRENNNISGMQGCNCSCDPILGALVGLQIALVIILIIGWTCSTCVIMKRTQVNQSKRGQASTDTVLISSSCAQSNPSYSSHASNTRGPEYETIPPRSTEAAVMEEYEAQSISTGQEEGVASSPKCDQNVAYAVM